ncbi:MAG: GAF domain-containing protein [Gemmatimonadaceae bacterium]|nr:GAF domain-containing protein [Gemmatimonadaceae bacterium]
MTAAQPPTAQLRAAFEQSPVSTVVYDATGRPIAANRSFERLWGASLADTPPDYNLLTDPQLDAAGMLPAIRRAFSGEAVTTPPIRYVMSDAVGRGHVVWTQGHFYPVRDEHGSVSQVVLTHEDVTGRMESEAQLIATARRAERLQLLTAALSTAATPDEVAQAVVAHAAVALDAAGVVIARITSGGDHLHIMQAGEMPDPLAADWQRFPLSAPVPLAEVARTGAPVFLESRDAWEERFPGMLPMLEMTGHHANAVMPLVVNAEVLGVIGAAFDAPRAFDETDRALAMTIAQQCAQALERARLYDAERRARQEAEAANRSKGEFLAAMSHELRTPLNAIAGHVQLLEMEIYGPLTAGQREALERIERAQRYLLRHVNDVLNFARLRAGRLEYELAPVELAMVIRELEPMIGPQLTAKSLTYNAEISPGQVALADREKLVQVLLNLVSNAAKFTAAGGTVVVDCVDRADGTGDPGVVFVRVSDSGVGIPDDKWESIFEPFVQVDASPAGRLGGTGLGLAISRDLVRGMGGDLRVRSTLGAGSSFTIALPRA